METRPVPADGMAGHPESPNPRFRLNLPFRFVV